jgi:predicted MFS family arabinose efflux permease
MCERRRSAIVRCMNPLSQRLSYALVGAVIALVLIASGTPSPLYETYRELWGFSPAVVTLIYATSAFGVLGSLLLAGSVSDRVGRRPVLLVSLAMLMGTTVIFMSAGSLGWLFVARAIQGVATGLALGAAAAALLDLHPRRDPTGVGLTNGVVSSAGMGLGVLISAALVELAPAPRVLPYATLLALLALAFAATLFMSEPVIERSRPSLTPQRPRVPPAIRPTFLLASLGVLASWSIGGLFLSLGPQLSATVFQTSNHLVAGIGVFALAASGATAQLAFGRTPPWATAAAGAVGLAAGALIMVASASADSAALFLAGGVVGGAGFGVAFMGALRTLSAVIPAPRRAEVMSALYVVAYASNSVPAVLAGILVTPLGLVTTFEVFGGAVAAVALVVAVGAWRSRPARRPSRPACCAAFRTVDAATT